MSKRTRKIETNLQPQAQHLADNHADHDHVHCREMLSSLGEYVDGTLGAELCAELERHMKGCNRCSVVVNTLKKTIEVYQEIAEETVPMPVEVRQRLYLRLDLEDYLEQ